MIGGFWVGRQIIDDYKLIASESPVAIKVLGKKVGDEIDLPMGRSVVAEIS
jgi:transcription elongation GreA/GreB family factor